MEGLKNMPKKKIKVQGLNIEIGSGVVVVELPESSAIALLTDNLKKITLTEKDFMQLAEYINNQN
jgi:hypothetical protein